MTAGGLSAGVENTIDAAKIPFIDATIRSVLGEYPMRTFTTAELCGYIQRRHPRMLPGVVKKTVLGLATAMPEFAKPVSVKSRTGKMISRWHWKYARTEADGTVTPSLYDEKFARTIGIIPLDDNTEATPQTVLDHALRWADKGIALFPAEPFTGEPLVTDWYEEATSKRSRVVSWWRKKGRYAPELGAVADRSDPPRFVVSASAREGGLDSLEVFEDANGSLDDQCEFSYEGPDGSIYFWFLCGVSKGAFTSHHKLGLGIHVVRRWSSRLSAAVACTASRLFRSR